MSRAEEKNLGFRALGENVRIFPGAKLYGREFISIGSNVIIDDYVFIYATAPIFIGSYVHIASFTSISGGGVVVLEDFSGLSSGVRILCGSEDFLGGGLTNPCVPQEYRCVKRAAVHIGRHAIIGANSVVLPGVTVGEGCAVGAGAVVGKSLEPWGVCLGSPARRIKPRESSVILAKQTQLMIEHPFAALEPAQFNDFLIDPSLADSDPSYSKVSR
ncbi:MAG: acyltransferase [Pseudomonas sp.]|nr:acyltransferase [Pseudomonas sp.]